MKPQNIYDLISALESDNNQYAMRVEPAYSPSSSNIFNYAIRHSVSQHTAAICLSSSWGLFQIMGENLYNEGLQISLPHYCCLPDLQKQYFQIYLKKNNLFELTQNFSEFISNTQSVEIFAKAYNGPGNVAVYAAKMKSIAQV